MPQAPPPRVSVMLTEDQAEIWVSVVMNGRSRLLTNLTLDEALDLRDELVEVIGQIRAAHRKLKRAVEGRNNGKDDQEDATPDEVAAAEEEPS